MKYIKMRVFKEIYLDKLSYFFKIFIYI